MIVWGDAVADQQINEEEAAADRQPMEQQEMRPSAVNPSVAALTVGVVGRIET